MADHKAKLLMEPVLALNLLNYFDIYKRCIHLLYHILDRVQQKKTKFIMEQPYMLPILFCQYQPCWCTGDLRSQVISRHGIDQISQHVKSLPSEELANENTAHQHIFVSRV